MGAVRATHCEFGMVDVLGLLRRMDGEAELLVWGDDSKEEEEDSLSSGAIPAGEGGVVEPAEAEDEVEA